MWVLIFFLIVYIGNIFSPSVTYLLTLSIVYLKQQPTPVFVPGECHGQRSLAGYSPWGHKESDTTKQLSLTRSIFNTAEIFNFGVIRSFHFPPLQVLLFLTYLKKIFLNPRIIKLVFSFPLLTLLV